MVHIGSNLLLLIPSLAMADMLTTARPRALVYRGNAACDQCPEAVARLLETSPHQFDVTYCGPNEEIDISPDNLKGVALYAFPGGPDLEDAWKEMKKHTKTIQEFVHNGGRYMGFCLGAYLAGPQSGLDLLPKGITVVSECTREGAQVNTTDDTVIQVDWRFSTGDKSGETDQKRWLYFQEGAAMQGLDPSSPHVIARYSSNQDVAASVTPFGNGWVGLCGPHPEATQDWYDGEGIKNPEGVRFDIGYDFVVRNATYGIARGGEEGSRHFASNILVLWGHKETLVAQAFTAKAFLRSSYMRVSC